MEIRETSDPPEDIDAELLVLFHLEDEPAPRGRLGRVDWILCGALSRLRARGKFAGQLGATALLLPDGKLKVDKVLVVGMGRRAERTKVALYQLSYRSAETVIGLRCTRVALEPPFRAYPQEDPARIRQAFFEGFLAELSRGRPGIPFEVIILSPENGA